MFALGDGTGAAYERARRAVAARAVPRLSMDSIVLGGILDRIESITEATISAIVNRIPDDYLAPEQRETIAKGLLTRRDLVRVLVPPATRRSS